MRSLFFLCSFLKSFSSPTSYRDFSFPRTCLCPCTNKKLRSEKLVTENHALSSPLFLDQTDGDKKNERTKKTEPKKKIVISLYLLLACLLGRPRGAGSGLSIF